MRKAGIAVLLAVSACQGEKAKDATPPAGTNAARSGIDTVLATVSIASRSLLPNGTHVKVALIDISRVDAPAVVISSEDRVTTGDQAPFRFALPFVLDQIPLHARLAVRATIEAEGKPAFTTTETYPVVTQGAPKTVDLVLQPVR